MKKTIILSTLVLISLNAFGNGAPIDYGTVIKSGRIKLISTPSVRILKENISIVIEGDYATFDITYILKNESWQNEQITYGFPVDYTNIHDKISNKIKWDNNNIPYFEIFVNKINKPIIEQIDFTVNCGKGIQFGYKEKVKVNYKRKWYVTRFDINKNEQIELRVKYKVKTHFVDVGFTGKELLPRYSKRYLSYDLSPAKMWGDGTILDFSLTLDTKYLKRHNEKMIIRGLTASNYVDGIYFFKKYNYKLNGDSFFELEYSNSNLKSSSLISKNRYSEKSIKNIKSLVISENANSLHEIFDENFSTSMIFFKNHEQETEWIEFEFDTLNPLEILILNGNYKTRESYYSYSRIKKLKVELEYIDYDCIDKTRQKDIRELEFGNNRFQILYKENYAQYLEQILPLTRGLIRMKLTILETYPGTQFSEISISELIFTKGNK